MKTELTVNGKTVTLEAEPNTLLVQALRERMGLTGTHIGCDTAQCGACTVIVDGNAIKSCNVLLAQMGGNPCSKHSKTATAFSAGSAPLAW